MRFQDGLPLLCWNSEIMHSAAALISASISLAVCLTWSYLGFWQPRCSFDSLKSPAFWSNVKLATFTKELGTRAWELVLDSVAHTFTKYPTIITNTIKYIHCITILAPFWISLIYPVVLLSTYCEDILLQSDVQSLSVCTCKCLKISCFLFLKKSF